MRGDRWVLAAIASSNRRHGSISSNAAAFAHLPSPLGVRASRSKTSMFAVSRFYSIIRSSSSSSVPSSSSSRSTSSTCRHVVSATPMVEGGEGGGESWCGHELLNTVTTEWMQDHLDDPEVAVVDIRGRVNKEREEGSDFFSTTYEGLREDYLDAHIPGAVFVDWTKDIARVDDNGVAAQLTDLDSFVIAMQERGVGGGRRVVVYDNGDMLFATRFWWAMRRFGFDRVSVMDGGWAKWMAENREITPDCPCPLKVFTEWTVPPERERPDLIASAADVRAALDGGRFQLLDARAAAQFNGDVKRARLGGHIPGAVNTPYRDFLMEEETGADGKYRVFEGLDGIRKVFEAASVDTSRSAPPVIAYCNGGVASTVALFLLFQLQEGQGRSTHSSGDGSDGGGGGEGCESSPRWANYDGSWNEWGNDLASPVEK